MIGSLSLNGPARQRRPSFLESVIWWRFFVALIIASIPIVVLLFVPQIKEKVTTLEFSSVGLKRGESFKNDIGMSFVYIEPGTFRMGRGKDEKEFILEDEPRKVTLTKGYWISVTEVTQEQYDKVMGCNRAKNKGDNIPVHDVTWEEAVDFCRVLTLREGRAYGLPTEAQWEYACRAGDSAGHYGPIDDIAWYFENAQKPQAVGLKGPNKFGLYDMLGNVAEWCWDIDYRGKKTTVDPSGISERVHRHQLPSLEICREVRGGHYGSSKRYCRASSTSFAPQAFRSQWLGFRVICTGVAKGASKESYNGGRLVSKGPPSFTVEGQTFPRMGKHLRFVKNQGKVTRFSVENGLVKERKVLATKVVAPQQGRPFINSFDMEFIWVEGGTFTMGSKKKNGPTKGDWQRVWITKGFWLSRYELTQSVYTKIMGHNPSKHSGQKRPVESVDWYSMVQFCEALSLVEGVSYRLPTEAEWEYAARAGSMRPRGITRFAWTNENSMNKTAEVGGKRANNWGFHDMLGNVAEWCQDCPSVYIPSRRRIRDPRGFETSSQRAVRGGSYGQKGEELFFEKREREYPSTKRPTIGGRILLVAQ